MDFVAYNSRWRIALIFVGALAFVAVGLWMAGVYGEVPRWRRFPPAVTIGVGWVSVAFFAMCAVAAARKFFDDRMQLHIGPLGIRWCPWSDAVIPWSEISDVTDWRFNGQEAIVLHLKDPRRFPGRGLGAMLAGANRKLTGGDLAISLTGTDRSHDDARSAIARLRP